MGDCFLLAFSSFKGAGSVSLSLIPGVSLPRHPILRSSVIPWCFLKFIVPSQLLAAPRAAQTPAPGPGRGCSVPGGGAQPALLLASHSSSSSVAGGANLLVGWLLDNSGDESKNLSKLTLQRGTDTAHLKQLLCSTLLFLALHLSACMA